MVGPASCGLAAAAASRFSAALLGLVMSCASPVLDVLALCRDDRRPPKEWYEETGLGEGGSEPASEPATLDSLPSVSTARLFDLSRWSSDLAMVDLERLCLELEIC